MYKRILVPVDGSTTSNLGLREAVKLAHDDNARIRLVHVVNELIISAAPDVAAYGAADMIDMLREGGRKILAKAVAQVQKAGVEPESTLIESMGATAADKIVAEAKRWRADVIVLGTHGRKGLRRVLMGSDAEEIVRATTVPVLLVRSKS
ncbi:MAG TPA: universal stress protein [Burkholderiales bacterium]|nr:universal stress protein [Burkholderiales bacterium]